MKIDFYDLSIKLVTGNPINKGFVKLDIITKLIFYNERR